MVTTKRKTTNKAPTQKIEQPEMLFAPASIEQQNFLLTDAQFAFYGGEHCASIKNLSIR